jgi:hypothetical protein
LASPKSIPQKIKNQVDTIVQRFNQEHSTDPGSSYYTVRYRGKYLYLDRADYGELGPICRLTFMGKMDNWGFAIYKYSSERYDPGEWFFPGSALVDGTIEGAMNAGLEAY